jgi:hypothetical protein
VGEKTFPGAGRMAAGPGTKWRRLSGGGSLLEEID